MNGSFDTGFGFTGEQTDDNDLLYLRARYYNPSMGIFPSLDPFEGTNNLPMSLNGYSWVEGNPVMLIDVTGSYPCAVENCIEEPDLAYGLFLQEVIQAGMSDGFQQECTSAPYSPFGCDQRGNPIPYAITQGFPQSGYQVGAADDEKNCPAWNFEGSLYPEHHCGVDMVSYSDAGFLWNVFREGGVRKVRIQTESGNVHIADIDNFVDETDGRQIIPSDLILGRVKLQYVGHNLGNSILSDTVSSPGRKVYAIHAGQATEWSSASGTLKVLIFSGENIGLEIQYTHLADCPDGSASPSSLDGTDIRAGQQIGCYAQVGRTNDAHLHVTYKQVAEDGTSLSQTAVNDCVIKKTYT